MPGTEQRGPLDVGQGSEAPAEVCLLEPKWPPLFGERLPNGGAAKACIPAVLCQGSMLQCNMYRLTGNQRQIGHPSVAAFIDIHADINDTDDLRVFITGRVFCTILGFVLRSWPALDRI